ncbi:MAG: hypothetical protein A2X12_08895 [Bacteroidetes bacterium GWE2_29_8]|nr:MAG: hypothetical protein A2X12_08895 [Bacteroidetes bacterium GWE2_29_8]OFY23329.1 MAG: hypothetical protein A2X02_08660 [Bacteroidetes bacterium GWF2_29_10]
MNQSPEYLFFDDTLALYNSMLDDFENAEKSIHIETYIFADDEIGRKFKNTLIKKAKQKIKIILLIDSWGSNVSESYFSELIKLGGIVKFFNKINILRLDYFTENHKRNHRKLIIIDNKITYIGSANINSYCLNWKESMLRINNEISITFNKIFYQNLSISYKYFFYKYPHIKPYTYKNYQIIRDVPSNLIQNIKTAYISLINNSQKRIVIESPYFLPGTKIIKSLINAVKRGVDVKIIMPKHSDVVLIDILRDRYLGILHNGGVKIYYYTTQNLHAKLMIVDNNKFAIGSANFDYRSFRFQFEILFTGINKNIVQMIDNHLNNIYNDCENFNSDIWMKRPFFQKILEKILLPFRHLF